MPPISIMIKPASSACNMDCDYCFYHDIADSRSTALRGGMSEEMLEEIIKKAFAFTCGKPVMISFQGGEPLLRGKRFFMRAAELIREHNTHRSPVFVAVQTNGTLIDGEWCTIFKRLGCLVGLSLDGDRGCSRYRTFADGKPAFDGIMDAARLLKSSGVPFNILCVLTKQNAAKAESLYSFFKKNGFRHLQFIPCLRPMRLTEDGEHSAAPMYEDDGGIYMTAAEYADFLKKTFDRYYGDALSGAAVSIRHFDNFVRSAAGAPTEMCGAEGHCNHHFVIEGDGEVFPCDFYCLDAYSMGSISGADFTALSSHPVALRFIRSSMQDKDDCADCPCYEICKGGCRRERTDIDRCTAYREFYKHAKSRIKALAAALNARQRG